MTSTVPFMARRQGAVIRDHRMIGIVER